MVRLFQKITGKAGLPPGTLVHVGEKKTERVKITVIDYDAEHFMHKEVTQVEDTFAYRDSPTITWINIDGLHDVSVIEKTGNHFGLHPLITEDILNTRQRPKMDIFDEYIFLVLKMQSWNSGTGRIDIEQLSIVLGNNYVLTFQERQGDVFEPLRKRIQNSKGKVRKVGSDYLAYAIVDSVVDNYFSVLEGIGGEIEFIEEELVEDPSPRTLQKIHVLKKESLLLRRSVWPLREIISRLWREDTVLVRESTGIYIRDLYDHTIQIIDAAETYRDMISGMLDVYLSSISNRMNEVMKVLTIFAAIFIPLTLIAGIYGMNFNTEKSPLNMPELNWYTGYPFALGLMVVIAVIMLVLFRRKKWL